MESARWSLFAVGLVALSCTERAAPADGSVTNDLGGITAERVIGPEGGAVSTPEGVTLTVPAGAVMSPTRFSIRRVDTPALPVGVVAVGPSYRMEPEGVRFAVPVRVSLPVVRAQVPSRSRGVLLLRLPPGSTRWLPIAGVAPDAASVSGVTRELSTYTGADLAPFFSEAGCAAAPTACDLTCSPSACTGSCTGMVGDSLLSVSATCEAGRTPGDPLDIECRCSRGAAEPIHFNLAEAALHPTQVLFVVASHCGWPCGRDAGGPDATSDAAPVTDSPVADTAPTDGPTTDGPATDGPSETTQTERHVRYRVVVFNQDIVPDGSLRRRRYCALGTSAINASGSIAFNAMVLDPNSNSSSQAILLYTSTGAGSVVYTTPGNLPGFGRGATEYCAPYLNDRGEVAFRAAALAPTVLRGGAWSGTATTLSAMALPAATAIGLGAEETMGVLHLAGFDEGGRGLLLGEILGPMMAPRPDRGVWRWSPGTLLAGFREGGAGTSERRVADAEGVMDGANGMAIHLGGGVGDAVHFRSGSGSIVEVTRDAMAPGTTDGRFTTFGGLDGAAGTFVFEAGFTEAGAPGCGVWSGWPTTPQLRLRTGTTLPGGDQINCPGDWGRRVAPQSCFSFFDLGGSALPCPWTPPAPTGERAWFRGPVMNAAGDVALATSLIGGRSALIRLRGATVSVIARSGDRVADLEEGVTFREFGPVSPGPVAPSINARGDIAFYATLAGTGVRAGENDFAILIARPENPAPRVLVRTGDVLPVPNPAVPGGYERARAIEFQNGSGGADGRRRGLSDSGEVAFQVWFVPPEGGSLSASGRAILVAGLRPR